MVAAALLAVGAAHNPALAGPYSKLQVLLPGEFAAPGSLTGKTGTPSPQMVGTPFQITVRACDDTWNTVTTITNLVAFGSSDGSATLPSPASLVAGEASVMVTLNAAGSFYFTAEDQSDTTIPLAQSSLVSAFALQGFEFARISQKNQYAGVPMSISVRAVDSHGHTVIGFSGAVRLKEITSYGEGRIVPSVVTFSSGEWSGNVTMYRADETSINRGNVNIEAWLQDDPSRNGTSDPFTVHPGVFSRVQIIVPGETPWPGSETGISGHPATQAAGHRFNANVFATDDYWNPVPSADVVRISSSDSEANTPVSGALVNGFQSFSITLGTVGTQTLTVNDQTNGSIAGMTSAGIPVIPSSAEQFIFETIPSPVDAGTPVTVTVRAADLNGNTIPDFNGSAILTANTGPGSIIPESITLTAGIWTGPVTFRGAGGAVTLSCSDYSSPPHSGTSNSIQVLPGPLAGLQVLLAGQSARGGTDAGFEGSPTDQNAGSSFQITVRAVDAYWNMVPGVNHRIRFTSTDLFAHLPAETTLVNGQITFAGTLYKSGHQTITAEDLDDTNVASHTSSSVQILPGTYARVLIVAPGEDLAPGTPTGRTGQATDQSINFAFTVTVYATDGWWNPVLGVTDMVHLTSTDTRAQLPADTPLVDGRADLNIRLTTGGYQQITVTNLTQPLMPPSTTQVRAITSGFHLEAEVVPTTIGAGETFTLTVKVTNDAGSVIQEVNSTVTIEVQNASTRAAGKGTLLVTHFQLLQGMREVAETYTFAEPIVLLARDDAGNDPALTEVLTVTPGVPAAIRLTSDPTWLRGNKTAVLSARIVDAYENGVPERPVLFSLVESVRDMIKCPDGGTLAQIDTLTDATGTAHAEYLSPRCPEDATFRAVSDTLSTELTVRTAFLDPNARGGTVTSYPNPFHPNESPTTIAYVLGDKASVTLKLYTLSGDLVLSKLFASNDVGGRAGLNEYVWDGRNGDGAMVASGGYVLVLTAQGEGETIHVMRRKIAVVR